MQYIEQVESLLLIISARRSGQWEGFFVELENLIKYFFAHDVLNYAPLMPVHLAQMDALAALMINAEGFPPAQGNARETERALQCVILHAASDLLSAPCTVTGSHFLFLAMSGVRS